MKYFALFVVLAGVLLASCTNQPADPITADLIPSSTSPQIENDTAEQQPEVEAADQIGPTSTPDDTAEVPLLTPEESYEAIAAVHAHILMVESWLLQGISDNQREAMLAPVAEMSISPLGDIFTTFSPQPAFTDVWLTAQDIHVRFVPQLTAWLNGELSDEAFAEDLMPLKVESNQLISDADQIAFQEYDIEIAEYQPDYALAMDIVFNLAVASPGDQAGPRMQTDLLSASQAVENENILLKEVTPYLYQFAGSNLLRVIGEVENTGEENLELAEISVRFYDVDEEYLGTLWGTTSVILIEPGKTYPFSASLVVDGDDIEIREQWVSYQASAAAHPLSYSPQAYYHEFDMVLLSVTETAPREYTIAGSITNLGAETVSGQDVFISAGGFDADGKLVGVGKRAALQAGTLAPGKEAPFEIVIQSIGREPVRYQFYAETLIVP